MAQFESLLQVDSVLNHPQGIFIEEVEDRVVVILDYCSGCNQQTVIRSELQISSMKIPGINTNQSSSSCIREQGSDRKWFLYSEHLANKNRKCSAYLKLFKFLRDLPSLALLFRDEEFVMMKAVEENEMVVNFLPDYMKTDRNWLLRLVDKNPFVLKHFDQHEYNYRKDLEVMKRAVSQNGYCLEYAHDELKSNRDLVLIAVRNYGMALVTAKSLRSDREVVLEAVKNNGLALEFANRSFWDDEEIVGCAVKSNGLALEFVSERLSSKIELIKEAISNNGLALEFATKEERDSIEIGLLACQQNQLAFKFCSKRLRHDAHFLQLLQQHGMVTNSEQEGDSSSAGTIVNNDRQYPTMNQFNKRRLNNTSMTSSRSEILDQLLNNIRPTRIPVDLVSDIEFAKQAVNTNGLMLKLLSQSVQEDNSIILDAIRNNGLSLKYVCLEKRYNNELVIEAAKQLVEKEHLKRLFH